MYRLISVLIVFLFCFPAWSGSPVSIPESKEKESKIEKIFHKLYKKEKLKQFGYEVFYKPVSTPAVSVGRDYIVGPGDQLLIYFWGDPVDLLGLGSFYLPSLKKEKGVGEKGQKPRSLYAFEVDREGKIFIPTVGVLYVWGRSLREVERELRNRLSRKFRRFSVEVSVGKLRSFPVYVSGFVNKPGVVLATGVHSVLDVLTLAGGVSKNGSLRNITLRRADGTEVHIDLYDLLIKGKPINIRVKDGDTIYVSRIGETVGVAGAVKRPAIYELKDERTVKDVVELAGGSLFSAYDYGVKVLRYSPEKLKVLSGVLSNREFMESEVKDGDLILIQDVNTFVWNRVSVEGHVQYPGDYSVEKYRTLKELLKVVGILPDTNLYYAEIVRIEKPGEDPKVIRFVPEDILESKKDFKLKPLDRVIFYPKWMYAPITVSGEVENPKMVPYYKGITLLDVLRDLRYRYPLRRLKVLILPPEKSLQEKYTEEKKSKERATEGKREKETIKEKSGKDRKEVQEKERRFAVKEAVYIYDLLVKGENNKTLKPGTKIVIVKTSPTEKDTSVTILGEVKKPGVYRLEKGMTLYDLIVKAGGYTERAYPRGLIFIRESAKKLQEEHLRIAVTALEESVARSEEGVGLTGAGVEEKVALLLTIKKQRELLNLIKQKAKMGLGRIALDIPPTLEELKRSPDNIPLEDGDYVYIPSKPNYVLVLGDVYNQISVPYVKGKTLSYYLEQVGGPGKNADLDNIYVIKANGRVISRRNYGKFLTFSWREGKLYFAGDFMDMPLEEGDTIVVPTELKVPTMWRPLIRDVVQIIFQAISTAVLAKRL